MSGAVIVTGASAGIGAAVCQVFLRRGHHVVGLSRRGADLDGGVGTYEDVRVDLRDDAATERAIRTAHAPRELGLGAVVLNAGISPPARPLGDVVWTEVTDACTANVATALHAVRHTAPLLRANGGGSLTFVGASVANGLTPERWPYAASKAALTSLMRACSAAYADDGVVANEVRPGPVATGMTLAGTDGLPDGQLLQVLNETYPMDWLKGVDTVAKWIAEIAGFPSNGPTGQIFNYSRKYL